MRQLRVGFVVTPSVSSERGKNETLHMNLELRPWLKGLSGSRFVIKDEDGDEHTTDDVAVARYVGWRLGDEAIVTLINPLSEDAIEIARDQDVVFLLIYDMLEAFHTLPRRTLARVERLLRLPNVFPGWGFQRLINRKNAYYAYLRDRGVAVLPFIHVSSSAFGEARTAEVDGVMRFVRAHGGEVVAKPHNGQEGIDFMRFEQPERHRVEAHLEKMFRTYRGVVFQPYVEKLEEGEFRVFFFGEDPVYMIRTGQQDHGRSVDAKRARGNDAKIIRFAAGVVKVLPPAVFRGRRVPRVLTRVDVACCYDGRLFVNEVEFVPSLFMAWTEYMLDGMQVDVLLGDQLIRLLRSDGFLRACGRRPAAARGLEGFVASVSEIAAGGRIELELFVAVIAMAVLFFTILKMSP